MTSVPAPTPQRPEAVVFDVVETLFSLDAVATALDRAGVGAGLLDVFFARMLRDAFALGSVDEYRTFHELAEATLTVVAPSLGHDDVATVLGTFAELGIHPDVAPAIDRLQQSGVRVAALTNGSAPNTRNLLEHHGIADAFDAVVSVDEVRTWKPRAAPYRYVADRLGLGRHRIAMVAVHAWDLHGARRAGLLTGWAGRLEHTWTDVFAEPDVTGWDLVDVADGLLALPSHPGT